MEKQCFCKKNTIIAFNFGIILCFCLSFTNFLFFLIAFLVSLIAFMDILKQPFELKKYFENQAKNIKIGFVPTMGALHEGHLNLVQQAKKENDVVVCSIFVNPTQFNNLTDLEKYPRTAAEDIRLLESVACDVLFMPEVATIYPEKVRTTLHFGDLESVWEGKFRAGHFNGVGLVVAKLFHLVKPTKAYFGQKDLQQCLIIKQLVRDYAFDIELAIVPTVRETDGLAMSSRNRRLSEEHRKIAPKIYEALQMAKQNLEQGLAIPDVELAYHKFLGNDADFSVEYFAACNTVDLQPLTGFEQGQEVALVTAVFLGEVRLIDNLIFKFQDS